jgi:enterochelin esterase-like enzyme
VLKAIVFLLLLIFPLQLLAIEVSHGTLHTLNKFQSTFVSERDVHIWLPDNYNEKERYAVIYMHDGQMLFDANVTWNKQEWGVDEMAHQLIAQAKVKPFIVVGVNGGKRRHSDYFPNKPFSLLTNKQQQHFYNMERSEAAPLFSEKINSDNYLKFLVTELKPYIDENFSVDSSVEATFVMGSSMGGLISLYALAEYPDIFGGAACLSTHWPGVMPHEGNPVPAKFIEYLRTRLPFLKNRKLYFDYGDQTLDAYYPPYQQAVDKVMNAAGFGQTNRQTLFFKGQNHSEDAWRSRLDKPLMFLLAPNNN